MGWTSFIGLQIEYSLIQRTVERELLPMAKALDLGIVAWAPLAGGALTGKYLNPEDRSPKRLQSISPRLNEKNTNIAREVRKLAADIGCSPAQAAINWVRQQKGVIIPIVGARSEAQIKDNLGCLSFQLTPEQMQRLDEISKIELGFPHDFLASETIREIVYSGMYAAIENHRL
jgi:aryl-alcohol dehydrogenase-like predicted oxidoreductase